MWQQLWFQRTANATAKVIYLVKYMIWKLQLQTDKIWGTAKWWSWIHWLRNVFDIYHIESFQILEWRKLSIILSTIIILFTPTTIISTVCCAVLCLVAQSCPALCNPMDCSPPGSSVHGDPPGKNTGVRCHACLQGIFPTQGWNPGLLYCRRILYRLSHQGSLVTDNIIILSTTTIIIISTTIIIVTFAAAAAAKSLQSCPTLCDPIDGSPPGSPVPGILQARILDWVAISSSNAWKWKVKVKSLSCVQLLATSWTAAHQAPLSMGFSRQEYWSGVPLPSLHSNLYWASIRLYECLSFRHRGNSRREQNPYI